MAARGHVRRGCAPARLRASQGARKDPLADDLSRLEHDVGCLLLCGFPLVERGAGQECFFGLRHWLGHVFAFLLFVGFSWLDGPATRSRTSYRAKHPGAPWLVFFIFHSRPFFPSCFCRWGIVQDSESVLACSATCGALSHLLGCFHGVGAQVMIAVTDRYVGAKVCVR